MSGRTLMRRRSAWVLVMTPILAMAGLTMATSSQASVLRPASPATVTASHVKPVKPNHVNQLDCNGYSTKYKALDPGMRAHCTDPFGAKAGDDSAANGGLRSRRFEDNGHYIGHDEPSVKFISHKAGSGNTMTYLMKLPVDPRKHATASGSVTHYNELSIAPWFGLPMCDPNSYPQNPCKPDSDTNTGSGLATDAGSAFMELQFYPPGLTPFADNVSCNKTKWCAAVTIDSLEGTFGFAFLNPACEEPVNFAFLQRNGVPAGPPSPQLADLATSTPNGQTLMLNPGDVLRVSITDPKAGFTTTVSDLTTGQTGRMVASAANGFMNTDVNTCDGTPHTFHAEYSTARKQNQVPWAALQGGVLMQQEIGHFESCNSVTHSLPVSEAGGQLVDSKVFQTCMGGSEGKNAVGEGPCDPSTGICQNASTEGKSGPVACPTEDANSGDLCEFSDGECFQRGTRIVTENGVPTKEHANVTGCLQNFFQNGDLDFDGTSYQSNTWPDGTANHPTAFRYAGPFTADGNPYPKIQFETDAPASESLCDVATGHGCDVKPQGSEFYPFWSLNNSQKLRGLGLPKGACIWNFGNVLPGVTTRTFGKDAQYGHSDVAVFGGTNISRVKKNPANHGNCTKVSI